MIFGTLKHELTQLHENRLRSKLLVKIMGNFYSRGGGGEGLTPID